MRLQSTASKQREHCTTPDHFYFWKSFRHKRISALVHLLHNQKVKMVKSTEKKSKKRKSEVAVEAAETADAVLSDGAAEQPMDGQTEKKLVLSPIATPLADAKLKKRTLKLVKKAAISKQLKRGVKEVVKALRKGSKG